MFQIKWFMRYTCKMMGKTKGWRNIMTSNKAYIVKVVN